MQARETERRYTKGSVELRTAVGSEQRVFHGYALKFGKLSQDLGGFVEGVAGRSTIAKTLGDGGDVVARMHHDDRYLLGRVSSGTLRLAPDDVGLNYDVDSPGTTYARDLEALATRGDIRHSSFAFRTIHDDWGLTESGFPLRTLVEIQLVDVAPVVNPAYLDTSSSVRSLASRLDASPDEVAELLRTGRIAKSLQSAAVVLDLAARKFDPRQPRGEHGKWSDGPGLDLPGGGSDAPEAPFEAEQNVRIPYSGVGVASDGTGGVRLKVKLDAERSPVLALSAADVDHLGKHLDRVDAHLGERKKLTDAFEAKLDANPDVQAKRTEVANLVAASKKFPPGHPERGQLQADAGKVRDSIPANPFDDGTVIASATAKVGGLHVTATFADDDPQYWISDQPITDDNISTDAVALSPKQARRVLAAVQSVAGARSIDVPAQVRPDALHLSAAVRARRLELLARRASL